MINHLLGCYWIHFIGLFGMLALLGAVYTVPWRRKDCDNTASKEYNRLWVVRLFLQLTAAAWLLCPFLELYERWSSEIGPLQKTDGSDNRQKSFCQSYVMIRLGAVEPFFLFLSLLTFSECLPLSEGLFSLWFKRKTSQPMPTLSEEFPKPQKRTHKNGKIICIALLLSTIVFFVQSVIPILDIVDAIKDKSEGNSEEKLNLPRSSLMTYLASTTCWQQNMENCDVCVIPLSSTLISALVIALYLWLMWILTRKMAHMALNICLEQRMRLFRYAVTVLLLSSIVFRGLALIWRPAHVLHEFCRIADFLSVLLFVSAFTFLLVIKPIREARLADRNSKKTPA